ncbi:hypothetical protein HG537_0D01130 [Torulaspora globosa]|uniref:Nuclear fusion protein KAR5 n=1 Tax=Torulaspora globosa TaxID=48254 RepID=A0A7H9HS49_9SACH|nr:hypothetical protein HG537_0D01130 [Torulaspora sp. CBS 2947]
MWSILWFLIFGLPLGESSSLDISSQLQQRLSAINTTDKVLAKEYLEDKFPFLKSHCVTEALKSFLPICLEKGIEFVDSPLRVEAAVKLSICEFKASGLEHIPNSCDSWDTESMMDCMIRLESSAQWWTTYSGNYQRLSSICFENSLPYEKQQILDLFLNVTRMYNDISDALRAQVYEIISDTESASRKHLENIANMFQEYMNDFSQRAKSNEEDIENDFIAHKDKMEELITRNSDAFFEELKKKDSQLINSLGDILTTTDRITTELSRMDITNEINDRNRAALEKWIEVDEIIEKIYDAQNENHNRMGKQWEDFLVLARDDIITISSDLAKSQARAFEALNTYDEMIKDTIIPSITNGVLPPLHALKEQILFEWQETAELITEDVMNWNNRVVNSFESISQNLNNTMEKVIDLDNRISKLHGLFVHIQKLLELLFTVFQHSSMIFLHLIRSRWFWAFAMLSFYMPKALKVLHSEMPFPVITNVMQLTLKWCMILIMIFIGSKVGTLIVSNNS